MPTSRVRTTVLLAAAALALVGCGDGPKAVSGLPPASPLTPADQVVPSGQWGVTNVTWNNEISPVAIKVGPTRRGAPGELKDHQSMTGGDLFQTAAPYYVSVHYVILSGSIYADPMNSLTGYDSRRRLTGAHVLLDRGDDIKQACPEDVTDPDADEVRGKEFTDCAVVLFDADDADPDQLVFSQTDRGQDEPVALRLALVPPA